MTKENIEQIKLHISLGELDIALEYAIVSLQGSSSYDDIIMLKGQFSDLQKKRNLNVISEEIYLKNIAKINFALIGFLNLLSINKINKKDEVLLSNLSIEEFKNYSQSIISKTEEDIRKLYSHKLKIYKQMFESFDQNIKDEYPYIIFERIIYADCLEQIELQEIAAFSLSSKTEWYYKCLVVSALTIRLVTRFDIERFELLVNFLSSFEHQVWQRALVGVIIASESKSEKIKGYPHIVNKLAKLKEVEIISKSINYLDEILRNRRFDIDEEVAKQIAKDYNEKIQKLTHELNISYYEAMQVAAQRGIISSNSNDMGILMSIFKKHKNYPFFTKPQHWFLPFYNTNQYIVDAMEQCQKNINTKEFIMSIGNSLSICNSDKYSLCFALDEYSDEQVKSCLQIFQNETIMSNEQENKGIITEEDFLLRVFDSYIQDFYTFYQCYSKIEFKNFFNYITNIYDSDILDIIIDNFERKFIIANAHFENKNYEQGLLICDEVLKLDDNHVNCNDLKIKLLFGLNRYEDAKAVCEENLNKRISEFLINALASSYAHLKQYEMAIEKYEYMEQIYPDAAHSFLQNKAYCFSMLQQYEKALGVRLKVYQSNPLDYDNLVSIALYYLAIGNYDQSLSIINNLLKEDLKDEFKTDALILAGLWLQLNNRVDESQRFYFSAIDLGGEEYVSQTYEDCYQYFHNLGLDKERYMKYLTSLLVAYRLK